MRVKHQLFEFCLCFTVASCVSSVETGAHRIFTPSEVSDIVDNSCFVGFNSDASDSIRAFVEPIRKVFYGEASVTVGTIELANFVWKPGRPLQFTDSKNSNLEKDVLVFGKRKVDRTCLMLNLGKAYPSADVFMGVENLQTLVDFINAKCYTYKNAQGGLSVEGLHREEILRTLYHVSDYSDVSSNEVFKTPEHSETTITISEHTNDHVCSSESCSEGNTGTSKQLKRSEKSNKYHKKCHSKDCNLPKTDIKMHSCEKISVPSRNEFFHNYLKISKPVIITGALDGWQAFSKWTNSFFRDRYGDRQVHIKLTPDGNFEGVEPASLFENFEDFTIPESVYKQLPYPDIVVVRPAVANMKLSEFIDTIEMVSNGSKKGFSAYLEYSSIADIIPELESDIEEMPFFDKMLKLEHSNIWLSDGNTLGKLHFDPFDNFLCQISGRKEVILFDPHDNTQLYEGHIPEAMLYYKRTTQTFHRKELVDTTSMVMSPVDILKPDYQRFPDFADTYPMNCTISEGEVLFMPAFWWHEVQSYPNIQQGRNLAVNYWYDPFLTREFPCPECQLDVNPKYRHLL